MTIEQGNSPVLFLKHVTKCHNAPRYYTDRFNGI
nr:MAG TPA: hypothetical protein [Caudoviricetes sp.]